MTAQSHLAWLDIWRKPGVSVHAVSTEIVLLDVCASQISVNRSKRFVGIGRSALRVKEEKKK